MQPHLERLYAQGSLTAPSGELVHVKPTCRDRLRRALKSGLTALARTDQDPSAEHAELFRRLVGAHAVALRKTADDTRRFDHFAPY